MRFEQGSSAAGIFIRERGGKANIYLTLYQTRQGLAEAATSGPRQASPESHPSELGATVSHPRYEKGLAVQREFQFQKGRRFTANAF